MNSMRKLTGKVGILPSDPWIWHKEKKSYFIFTCGNLTEPLLMALKPKVTESVMKIEIFATRQTYFMLNIGKKVFIYKGKSHN